MAEIKRVSGRQGGGPPGPAPSARQPAANPGSNPRMTPAARPQPGSSARIVPQPASGRLVPPPANPTGSGRLAAAQNPSASGRLQAPAPVAAQPAARPSGRMPAAAPTPAKARVSQRAPMKPARASKRGPAAPEGGEDAAVSGRFVKRKKSIFGPELMIAAGLLTVLAIAVAIIYTQKTGAQKEVNDKAAKQQEVFKSNINAAVASYKIAENAGVEFIRGEKEGVADDVLFGPFKGNAAVYNVIYNRRYKDRHGNEQTEQKKMQGGDALRIDTISTGEEQGDLKINYAFGDSKRLNLVVAKKSFKPKEGDEANLGGDIIVMVKAQDDKPFEDAKNPPAKKD